MQNNTSQNTQPQAIKKIVINGIQANNNSQSNELACWFTAIVLLNALKDCDIELVLLLNETTSSVKSELKAPITLTAQQLRLLRNIGIDEKTLVQQCQGAHSLGNWYQGWQSSTHSFLQVDGEYGAGLDKIDFHHWYSSLLNNEKSKIDLPAYDAYSLAALMAKSGKFIHPVYDNASILSTYQYQLNVEQSALAAQLKKAAIALGVKVETGNSSDVVTDETRSIISHVRMENKTIDADFFIDCASVSSFTHVFDKSNYKIEHSLLKSKSIRFEVVSDKKFANIIANQLITTSFGWMKVLNLRDSQFLQCLYSDDENHSTIIEELTSTYQIEVKDLINEKDEEPINNQLIANAWQANCLFIGKASSCLEPIVENELTLIHHDLQRWLAIFPNNRPNLSLIRFYNESRLQAMNCVTDFIENHYYFSCWRNELFWLTRNKNITTERPQKFALTLFQQTGIFPQIENQYYPEKYWVSWLMGFNVQPKLVTPLVTHITVEQSEQALQRLAKQIYDFSDKIPNYQHYLTSHGL